MAAITGKVAPKREDRHGTCTAFGGSACSLRKQGGRGGCAAANRRSFGQGSICQLIPAISILDSIPEAVVIVHGAVGCGGSGHAYNAGIRWREILAGSTNPKGVMWLTTALDERDVVIGGEPKLEAAITEADRRYRPTAIFVVSSCVPGVIGDDIDAVAAKVQPTVSATVVPVHCEGFRTGVMATAYDNVYHGIAQHLLGDALGSTSREQLRRKRLVNLLTVSSMGPTDEQELVRLLTALGLEVNTYPVFTRPERMREATRAALSISTCPTHDDYFVEHLKELYGIPYLLHHMPIGISNTDSWLRDIAGAMGLEEVAERLIAAERAELARSLAPILPSLAGKRALISAGEVRTLATAGLLQELGMEIVALRPYHYDQFGETDVAKLVARQGDFTINVATGHPYEEVALIELHKPDIFLGHMGDTVWAAKSGVPVLPVYVSTGPYVGYAGAFDVARRLKRVLRNPGFNTQLAKRVRQPYKEGWIPGHPFAFVEHASDEGRREQ